MRNDTTPALCLALAFLACTGPSTPTGDSGSSSTATTATTATTGVTGDTSGTTPQTATVTVHPYGDDGMKEPMRVMVADADGTWVRTEVFGDVPELVVSDVPIGGAVTLVAFQSTVRMFTALGVQDGDDLWLGGPSDPRDREQTGTLEVQVTDPGVAQDLTTVRVGNCMTLGNWDFPLTRSSTLRPSCYNEAGVIDAAASTAAKSGPTLAIATATNATIRGKTPKQLGLMVIDDWNTTPGFVQLNVAGSKGGELLVQLEGVRGGLPFLSSQAVSGAPVSGSLAVDAAFHDRVIASWGTRGPSPATQRRMEWLDVLPKDGTTLTVDRNVDDLPAPLAAPTFDGLAASVSLTLPSEKCDGTAYNVMTTQYAGDSPKGFRIWTLYGPASATFAAPQIDPAIRDQVWPDEKWSVSLKDVDVIAVPGGWDAIRNHRRLTDDGGRRWGLIDEAGGTMCTSSYTEGGIG